MFLRRLTSRAKETLGTGLSAAKRGLGVQPSFNVQGTSLEHLLPPFMEVEESVNRFSHLCSAFLEVSELVEEGVAQMTGHVLETCDKFQKDQEFVLAGEGLEELDALELNCGRLRNRVQHGVQSQHESKEKTIPEEDSLSSQPAQHASKLKLCRVLSNVRDKLQSIRKGLEYREELAREVSSTDELIKRLRNDLECDKVVLLSSEQEQASRKETLNELHSQLEKELKKLGQTRVVILSDLFEQYKRCQADILIAIAAEVTGNGFDDEYQLCRKVAAEKYSTDSDLKSSPRKEGTNETEGEKIEEFLNIRSNRLSTHTHKTAEHLCSKAPAVSPLVPQLLSQGAASSNFHSMNTKPNFGSTAKRAAKRHTQLDGNGQYKGYSSSVETQKPASRTAPNFHSHEVPKLASRPLHQLKRSELRVDATPSHSSATTAKLKAHETANENTTGGLASRDKVAQIVRKYRRRQGKPIFNRPADFQHFEMTVRELQRSRMDASFRSFHESVHLLARGVVSSRGEDKQKRLAVPDIQEAASTIQKFWIVASAQCQALKIAHTTINRCNDATSGYFYYYNHNTQTSSWSRPWVLGRNRLADSAERQES